MAKCSEVELGWVPSRMKWETKVEKIESIWTLVNLHELLHVCMTLPYFNTAGMDYDYLNTYCTRMEGHWDLVRRLIHHDFFLHWHQEPKVEKNLRLGWLRCFKNLGGIIQKPLDPWCLYTAWKNMQPLQGHMKKSTPTTPLQLDSMESVLNECKALIAQ